MLRISKLTDYGMVIVSFLAGRPQHRLQAKGIAEQTGIAAPTVSKLLKILARHKLLKSFRGTHGGFQLALDPEAISVADLIKALEGPIALTECNLGHAACPTESLCALRSPWLKINQVVTDTLSQIKVSQLAMPKPSPLGVKYVPFQ